MKKKEPNGAKLASPKKQAQKLAPSMLHVLIAMEIQKNGWDLEKIGRNFSQEAAQLQLQKLPKALRKELETLQEGTRNHLEIMERNRKEQEQEINKLEEEDGWIKVQKRNKEGKKQAMKETGLQYQTPKRKRDSEEIQFVKKVDARSSASKREQVSYAEKAKPNVKKTPFFRRFPGGLQVHREDTEKIGCTLEEWRSLEGYLEVKMWEKMASEDLASPIAHFMGYSRSGYGLIACTTEENKQWFKKLLMEEGFRGWGSEEKTERERELLEQKKCCWTFLVRPAPDKRVGSQIIMKGINRINKLNGNFEIIEEFAMRETDNVRVISIQADKELQEALEKKTEPLKVGYGRVTFANRVAKRPQGLTETEKSVEVVTEPQEDDVVEEREENQLGVETTEGKGTTNAQPKARRELSQQMEEQSQGDPKHKK